MTTLPSFDHFECDGDVSSVGTRWQKWKRALQIYLEATSIEEPKKRKATLLHFGGLALQEIFFNLPGADAQEPDVDGNDVFEIAIKKLNEYFAPKQSKVYERHLFRLIKQDQEEKFEKFLVRLRHQADKCGFQNVEEQLIDQITEKCISVELRKKILSAGDSVNLNQIILEANSLETIERQLTGFKEVPSTSSSLSINTISMKNNISRMSNVCSRCGFMGPVHNNCPARNIICNKCKFKGHFAKYCKSTRKFVPPNTLDKEPLRKKFKGGKYQASSKVDNISEANDETEYVFHLDGEDTVSCNLGGVEVDMLIDSGSKSNIISEKTWEFLKKSQVSVSNQNSNPNKILFAYGSTEPLHILGSFEAIIKIDNSKEKAVFYVIKNGKRNLLGKDTAILLGVLKIGSQINNVNIIKPFPKFKNVIVHIPIDKTVIPISQPYRRIPIPLEAKINKKLDELIKLDIIEEVNGPSEWVSPIVPVLKENGDVRICIDMRKANTAIQRENYPLPTIDSLLSKFRKAKFFSRLDIKNAFYQVEISPKSRYITTFISSKGLYRYKRLLFGINAAPEMFQKILERMLLLCDGTVNFIDDILIYGCNEDEHDQRVKFTLNILKENNVLLNKEKCIFKIKTVTFLGHTLSPKGIRPLESYIGVVKSFRTPENVDEVHSFLGLINFVGKWIPNLATLTEPLRKLLRLKLSKNTDISKYWGDIQTESFKKLKEGLSNIKTLGYYDPSDRTQVIADASPVGLGAVLVQFDKEGPRIIAYGNKSLTDVEKRYCQTEKEALAIVWAVEHFKMYLYGKDTFELITDHKPLETIFGPRSRPCARIERWVLRLQSFNFKIIYHPGKNNIADPLSRLCKTTENTPFGNNDCIQQLVEYSRPVAVTLNEIKENSETDEDILKLKTGINQNIWADSIKHCQTFKEEFCWNEGILLRGTRIVIPYKLRQRVLEAAHEGHPGIVAMKSRLRTKVWWPKIDDQAEKIVRACKGCTLVSAPIASFPMKRRQLPTGPWIDVAIDFMGPLPKGEYLFVIVDYFSRYKEIKIMKNITSTNTISVLKEIFSRLGSPASITCDNGRQFTSEEIRSFCKEYGIKIYHIIPYWPQMNGEVERQNRDILKRLKISQAMKTNWQEELIKYLTMYNSTPHTTTGKTPSELFFRRQFRDKLPTSKDTEFNIFDSDTVDRDQTQKQKGKDYENRKRGATHETDINVGDQVYQKVFIKPNKISPNFDSTEHTVVEMNGGDVLIKNNETGQQKRRNIVHLKKVEGQWQVSNKEELENHTTN